MKKWNRFYSKLGVSVPFKATSNTSVLMTQCSFVVGPRVRGFPHTLATHIENESSFGTVRSFGRLLHSDDSRSKVGQQ